MFKPAMLILYALLAIYTFGFWRFWIWIHTNRCMRCGEKFNWRKSKSQWKPIFCSVECEYTNLLHFILDHAKVSMQEVVEYLSHDPRYKHFSGHGNG